MQGGRPETPGRQDGTDPYGGRHPTKPTPKPEVAENTIPYSPAGGAYHGRRTMTQTVHYPVLPVWAACFT